MNGVKAPSLISLCKNTFSSIPLFLAADFILFLILGSTLSKYYNADSILFPPK